MHRRDLARERGLGQLLRVHLIVLPLGAEDQAELAGVSDHRPRGRRLQRVVQPAVPHAVA
jgi:hypothetical protein